MDNLEKKTRNTERWLTYTYYISPKTPSTERKPALLLVHGFPDSAHLWQDIIPHLAPLGNRIIALDLLGYAGSSKPADIHQYDLAKVQQDIVEILTHEGITKIIAIGHDWGSLAVQRLYFYNPELVVGLSLIAVGLMPPSPDKFDLKAINEMTETYYGFPKYAYVEFLSSEEAPGLISANIEKFWEIMHGSPKYWLKTQFCTRGAMKNYLEGNDRIPLKPYAQLPKWKDEYLERYSAERFEAPCLYYRSLVQNIQWESDQSIPLERRRVEVPVCYIGSSEDIINPPEQMEQAKEHGMLAHLEAITLETGHWSVMECPDKVSKLLIDFISQNWA
ncbi:Alpha/Beta hydrolase protein [Cadophora sp. MPI-SDFR-AT-0126]|nr:Alpha/Beta hydrolase protein [Leotiomycetes sp. MPI-SDFR-AT-0126]